jgi:Domain of unknown function (DUF4232)
MKLFSTTARRVIAVAAAAAAAGLAISTAAYAATSAPGQARSIPRCTAEDLGVWVAVDQSNGAAGTIRYPLEFTNLSHHTCFLFGYPGVSALDHNGHQLGRPASWDSRTGARTVYLAPGATAHTLLAYDGVLVIPGQRGCGPVRSSVALRVYPPDQRSATHASFSVDACSHAGPVYLSVTEPIIPGVGTIYG